MGTSDFALPTLQKIYQNKEFEIIAVYTKTPSIAGRGHKISYSPIYQFAQKNNLKIITPKNFKEKSAIDDFINLQADIAIVISYGLILPREILNGTKFGCYNIHPSALPLYRGPSPLQESILNNENESSVCIIKMDEGIDSGDIVNQQQYFINSKKDYPIIAQETSEIGAKLMIQTLNQIANNQIILTPQNHKIATFTKKIDKSATQINWQNNCLKIYNQIRAFNGNLFAFFIHDNEKIKILKADYQIYENLNFKNGEIIDKNFAIKCYDGIILPKILQREGRKPLLINEFLNGFKINIGKILS